MALGKIPGLVLAAGLLAMAPRPSAALELVQGGYGAAPVQTGQATLDPVDVAAPADRPGLALEFTPRSGTGLWDLPRAGESGGQQPRFDLTIRGPGTDTAIDRFGLGTSRDALRANTAQSPTALTVGGAMRWSDWTVGGGLGRAQVLGENVDLMSATLGYGRITAGVAYGQSTPAEGNPQDVLMFSTDLAAWSWLTLESDLALGSHGNVDRERTRDREPVAAGRLGLRLNF